MNTIVCPVCTLYLRNNITLEDHLRTHPKAKVIEALISVSTKNAPASTVSPPITIPPWQQTTTLQTNNSIFVPVQTNNSSIIYQQFVSSNTTHNCLTPTVAPNIVPQYITIPTNGFNQQPLIMNQQPYLYQHQQQQVQLMTTPIVPVGFNYQTDQQIINAATTATVQNVPTESTKSVMINPIDDDRQPVISINQNPPEPIKKISQSILSRSTASTVSIVPAKSTITEDIINKPSNVTSQSIISNINQDIVTQSVISKSICDQIISEPNESTSQTSGSVVTKSTNQIISEPLINKSTNQSIITQPVINRSTNQDIVTQPLINKTANQSIIAQSVINKSTIIPQSIINKSMPQSLIEKSNSNQTIISTSEINKSTITSSLIEKSSNQSLIDKSSSTSQINQTILTTSSSPIQIDRSTVVCTTKKSNTPPVSVSTIQLADITISTEVVQKDSQKSIEYNNSNQMEIIPIYNRKNNSDQIDLDIMDQSQIKVDEIEVSETKVNKKTVIEIYSNENTQCEKMEIETFHENEKSSNDIDLNESSSKNADFILPDVSFYQISKFEDVTAENMEPPRTSQETKNDIVIIKNEVICLPPPKNTSLYQSSLPDHDDDTSFKVENNDLETDAYGEIVEFGDIKLMLNNDMINHIGGTTATVVNDLQCMEDIYDDDKSSPVLLNIGEMVANKHNNYHENSMINSGGTNENYSRDGLNIRADECMPPKGELSEQESNGAGDEEVWGKMFQEGSSGISSSYDLIARESWEASDSSDSELTPPLQSRISPIDNNILLKNQHSEGSKRIAYKCSYCKEIFNCPKERRVHQTNMHDDEDKLNFDNDDMDEDDDNNVDDQDDEEEDMSNIKLEDEKIIDPNERNIEEDKKLNVTMDSKQKHCEICDVELETVERFNEHYRIEHPNTAVPRYKCSSCQQTFSLECKFSQHLKIHPLICQICYKLFYKQHSLQAHLRRVHLMKHSDKKYTCEVCSEKFTTYAQKNNHINSKHPDVAASMFKCTLCGESFRRRLTLKQHRDTVHQKKKPQRDYVCHCGETFKSKNRYTWHSEIHESKPKACTFCSEKFVHTASLTRHIRIAHNENYIPDDSRSNENVPCPICKKMYLKSSLDVHIKIHTGVKPFACHICNKVFTTKWNLKLHKWTHAARLSKPYKCNQCQSAFIRQNDYVSHMNSHRNIKPYTCNHCGRQFIRKYNCQRHVREHERDKSYKCNVCNKEFHRSYYLREHLRVHSGDRPFSCHICGKTSTTKSNHNKHMRIHHARDPVSTEN